MCPKIYKVALCGKQFVGKTSIFLRMRDGNDFEFDEERSHTEHVDQCILTVSVRNEEDTTEPVQLQFLLCDTVGLERYQSLSRSHYHGSTIILLVYSVDDPDSLSEIQHYYEECKRHAAGAYKVLVRNKVDLTEDDEDFCVPYEEEAKLANQSLRFTYPKSIKTSAKLGKGINTLKRAIGKILLKASQSVPERNSITDVTVSTDQTPNRPCC